MKIAGSVIIVTGASHGIGEVTARELADRGATVVLAARNAERLQAVADEITAHGGTALAVPTDLRKREEIERLVATTLDTYGRVDVLINNAGIVTPRLNVTEMPDETIVEFMEVNLLAPVRCVKAVVPQMRKQGGGVIIDVGSITGEIATPDIYATTKFGLRGLSDAVRRELARDNIHVVLIEPGFIRDPGKAPSRLPMPGPELVARRIARAIEHPRRKIITPWEYRPVVIAAKHFPGAIDWVLSRVDFRKAARGETQNARGAATGPSSGAASAGR